MRKPYLVELMKQFGTSGLGSVQSDQPKPLSARKCVKTHTWTTKKFNRRCSKCGVEEDFNSRTREWE